MLVGVAHVAAVAGARAETSVVSSTRPPLQPAQQRTLDLHELFVSSPQPQTGFHVDGWRSSLMMFVLREMERIERAELAARYVREAQERALDQVQAPAPVLPR